MAYTNCMQHTICICQRVSNGFVPEVESSRTSLASRTSSRTDFEVLGLGLEASSPQKLACPRLEDSTTFWIVKILWSTWKIFGKRFFVEIAWKIFVKTFFFRRSPENFLWRLFFLESTCACVLGPWPRAFLSLASRVSVLGKAVLGLGLGFFLCPWPRPRVLCPRLHLWFVLYMPKSNFYFVYVSLHLYMQESMRLRACCRKNVLISC